MTPPPTHSDSPKPWPGLYRRFASPTPPMHASQWTKSTNFSLIIFHIFYKIIWKVTQKWCEFMRKLFIHNKIYEISKWYKKTKQNVICSCSLLPVCACLAPVVSGLSSRAQQHHIDMKIAPQIIFYENVARGSGSIMASSNVISIPQSCIIFVSSVMEHLLWWIQKSKIFCTRKCLCSGHLPRAGLL